ncbi:pyridoxal-phosphate dependent enzyme [uncultured Clostridium sp.]|uniref:1-aminocyclopropane-1-carboxylate deaminase/D-cysteine desulfhydrase n=1 Tax=uncultured Clostridium sp. TaxID=59620 RepID=UPI0028EB8BA0|nr:pyridoxal-phosphate dependent enzyme [uncultured Clostridium sp.]
MRDIIEWIKTANKVNLGTFPTPLHRLERMEKELDYGPIYIKRDDLTGLGAGGNKIRSLEFILGDAIKKNCNLIIVSGPPQSNLCSLTASACAKLGLKCVIVNNGEKPDKLQGNILLNHILNAEIHTIGIATKEERDLYVKNLFIKYKNEGNRPYVIKNGATTGMGALGYVSAAIEMQKQCLEGKLPIKTIFAPGGNGGVAAGLIYGNALLGLPFQVNIISVEDDKDCLTHHILKTIDELVAITQIPFNYKLEDVCNITDKYSGEGWGINTKESANAVFRFAQLEGIFIENIYNSKVLVGMEAAIKNAEVKGGVCYLHTGGFASLFSQF